MDDDATTADRSCRIGVISGSHIVIVDGRIAVVLVPDLYPEQVNIGARCQLVIDRGQHEPVGAFTVDSTGVLVLCFVMGNHQPVMAALVEVEVGDLELELGLANWYISPLLVFRDKTEVGLTGKRGISSVGSLW